MPFYIYGHGSAPAAASVLVHGGNLGVFLYIVSGSINILYHS
jgi:hypothetical protein